jgi:hypothetical protein
MSKSLSENINHSTDMMAEYFATSAKLVPEDERVYYVPEPKNSNHDKLYDNKDAQLDDSIDDFIDKNENQDNKSHKDQTEHSENYLVGEKKISPEDLVLQKLDMLRKLGELSQQGIKLSQNYNLNSDLKIMKYEYELHRNIRAKQNSINWMSSMTLNAIYGIEMLNDRYNPFDLKLKGWSEQMNAGIDNYYDVFGELYEKYSTPGKSMAPELKLMLMISGSALKFHLSSHVINTLPNLNEALNNNPELMAKLRSKAVQNPNQNQNPNPNPNPNPLSNKMNAEHNIATQKASDLQMIKEKELEYLNAQKMMAEKQAQLMQLRTGLQTVQPVVSHQYGRLNSSPVNSAPVNNNNNNNRNSQTMNKQPQLKPINLSPELLDLLEEKQNKQKDTQPYNLLRREMDGSYDNEYDVGSMASSATSKSSQSIVSINPNIVNIVSSPAKSAKNKKAIKIEKDDITSISLGSKKSVRKSKN